MIDPVDAKLLMPAAAKEPEGMTPEKAFDRELARWVVKELTETLFDEGSPMAGAAPLASLFQDALADRLVDHGPAAGLIGRAHGPAPQGTADDVRETSGFGMRLDPLTGAHRAHKGVDLAAPRGTSVRSARAGVVTFAGSSGGYGNLVVVDHGGGLETRYAHLQRIDVEAGAAVTAGAAVGTVGSTGRSTGPHLHFEARRGGEAVDPHDHLPGFAAQVVGEVRR
ncbi:MAG: M23 family metallopeptidase [Alphaproteobacteria bacterium]|nr:M23 family metallopeptidase [Alphaproteobacteria bacterium]MCB9690972.1 M23 family metallopeptidase [Alphaproteobacteria bacterium]